MTDQERRELTEKLLAASVVTKPFTPPDSYQQAINGTSVNKKTIGTSVGDTDIWIVEPKNRPKDSAVLINFHGGGFVAPHTQRDVYFCQRLAWELNIMVVDIEYYTATEHPFPTACYQSYECVKWVHDHAKELGVDTGKIITAGHSAGGNLVLAVSLLVQEGREFSVMLQVLDYPPLDLATDPADKKDAFTSAILPDRARSFNLLYLNEPENGKKVLASPIFANPEQLAGMPETVIITGGRDNLRHEAEEYASKLISAGVPVHCREFTRSRHGFVISCVDEYNEAIAFIEKNIRQTIME